MIRGFRAYAFRSTQQVVAAVRGAHGILVALNAEKVARADPEVRALANRNFGYPDGAGVVLALRRKGLRSARIAGSDLWLELIRDGAPAQRVYLIGSTSRVIEETARRLGRLDPKPTICGYRDGFLRAGEDDALADELIRLRPGLVLVAMGSPRQEVLMARLSGAWPALYMGLGGSFDVFVGAKPRAPAWMQRVGLEWAYQFVRTPRRLRRLPAYVRFACLLAIGRL